jgi:hypothetical protein
MQGFRLLHCMRLAPNSIIVEYHVSRHLDPPHRFQQRETETEVHSFVFVNESGNTHRRCND